MDRNQLHHVRRNVKGFSQTRLSDLTGIPQTTISCWERNIGEPTVSQAQKLAGALGVPLEDLFVPDGHLADNQAS
ncbi:MAG: helix-turn-helix domain-containing protein [Deltaproteobacteria bacterium]|nr:helix-turn-helix domain-containing protein [Deltaproteobacteria bacterium]